MLNYQRVSYNHFEKQQLLVLLVGIPTPLKNDGVKVSWDDGIPNVKWKNNPNVPNHQPDYMVTWLRILNICEFLSQEWFSLWCPSSESLSWESHDSNDWWVVDISN